MSSEKLLNEMLVVLSAVMDHLDFRSIMMMRKVCHDFRNFIDEVVPSSSMTKIFLTVRPHSVELILEDSKTKTEARYEKVYALQNIWNDLNIILKHQKEVVKSFFVGLDNYVEDVGIDKEVCEKAHSEFLNQLQNNLIARKYPLKVTKMRFMIIHQHEIMSVLPYINSEKLECISIYHSQELERPMLNLDEVVETKQWKNAKELKIFHCYVVEPIKKFSHFERCEIYVKTFSLEFLRHVIEILLNHQSLKSFTLHDESGYESEELKRWLEILFDGVIYEGIWYKRIPGSEDNFLKIENSELANPGSGTDVWDPESEMTFSRSRVPDPDSRKFRFSDDRKRNLLIRNPESVCRDPGSRFRDLGSGFRDPGSGIPNMESSNPESRIANLNPGTRTQGLGIPNPESRNPESEIRNPKSGIRNPESGIRNPESGIQNPESGIRNPESGIRNPESGIRNPESGIRNPESGIRNPESGIRNLESGIRHPGSRNSESGKKNPDPGIRNRIPSPVSSREPREGRTDSWVSKPIHVVLFV